MMRPTLALAIALSFTTPAAALAQISKKEFPPQPDLTQKSPDDVVPTSFRGKIVYRGFYRGKAFVPGPAPRTLSLGAMLQSAMNAKTLPMGGDFVISMEFNGTSVSGTLQITNGISGEHGSLDSGHFMGTREGTTCQLMWNDGSSSVAYCGRSEYRAAGNQAAANGIKFAFAAQIPAAETIDYVERDRQNAIAQAQSEARAREIGLAAADPMGKSHSLAQSLDAAVAIDSQGWAFNRYAPGSMTNVTRTAVTQGGRSFVLNGNFRYQSGNSGWVKAKVENGQYSCLIYWDFPNNCRPVGTMSDGSRLAIGAVISAMAPGGGGGRSNSRAADDDEETYRDNQRDIERQAHASDSPPPEPQPVEPIGGDRGLYGTDHSCCGRR